MDDNAGAKMGLFFEARPMFTSQLLLDEVVRSRRGGVVLRVAFGHLSAIAPNPSDSPRRRSDTEEIARDLDGVETDDVLLGVHAIKGDSIMRR